MSQEKRSFRHESLQDIDSIQALLKALSKGLAKHKLSFTDEDGEISLEPEGLLNLKLTASNEEGRQRVNLRITWQVEDEQQANKTLRVK